MASAAAMKKPSYIAIGILALGALWLAYYALSPLFRDIKVDEAIPQASQGEDTNAQQQGASVTGTEGHPASGTARVIA